MSNIFEKENSSMLENIYLKTINYMRFIYIVNLCSVLYNGNRIWCCIIGDFKCGLGLERGPPSLVRTIG